MNSNSFLNKFINEKDRLDPESYRKGRFFVISNWIFFIFCLLGEVWVLTSDFSGDNQFGAALGNGILILVMVAMFYAYKKYGKRVLWVNIISVLGYMSNIGTYNFSGGIYSSDLVNGVIICSWIFLVADKKSGLTWFAITFLTITFFYIADVYGLKDFKSDAIAQGSYYPYFNYGFGCVFAAIIITLHENNKEKYLKDLKNSKLEIETKSKELETKNEEIVSSINYAKRIQYAMLPHEETIYRGVPLSFIFYQPKDIVSGDFFWYHEIDKDNYIIVAADCTGHGVPGAFMTVIGSNLLTQIVAESGITQPGQILQELDKRITNTLKQQKEHQHLIQDGMDMALLKVNKAAKEFSYTSAKRPAIFIRNKQLQELKGSKNTLGGLRSGNKHFEEIKIKYEEDDMIYLFTDGYIDQFGGADNKKFMIKRFRELLVNIQPLSINEQKEKIASNIEKWIGHNEQTDDILVIGIRF